MTEIDIKILLVKHFLTKYRDFIIGSEVSFQFGERRADLVIYESNMLSVFEIKSARDSVLRLEYQIKSYKKFFDFCFIVCEQENLAEVRAAIPDDIGLCVIKDNSVIQVRRSKQFKRLDKSTLSSVLNVQKLKSLIPKTKIRSKHDLNDFIVKNYSLKQLKDLSRGDFIEKYEVSSRLMKQEVIEQIHPDDIYTITKKAPSKLRRKSLSK